MGHEGATSPHRPGVPNHGCPGMNQRKEASAGATGLEPATSGVTGRRSNQLNYAPRTVGSVPGGASSGASLAPATTMAAVSAGVEAGSRSPRSSSCARGWQSWSRWLCVVHAGPSTPRLRRRPPATLPPRPHDPGSPPFRRPARGSGKTLAARVQQARDDKRQPGANPRRLLPADREARRQPLPPDA